MYYNSIFDELYKSFDDRNLEEIKLVAISNIRSDHIDKKNLIEKVFLPEVENDGIHVVVKTKKSTEASRKTSDKLDISIDFVHALLPKNIFRYKKNNNAFFNDFISVETNSSEPFTSSYFHRKFSNLETNLDKNNRISGLFLDFSSESSKINEIVSSIAKINSIMNVTTINRFEIIIKKEENGIAQKSISIKAQSFSYTAHDDVLGVLFGKKVIPFELILNNKENFHPSVIIKADSNYKNTQLDNLLRNFKFQATFHLFKTYFFDPYQIDELKNKKFRFKHFGQIELELPAESIHVDKWGSVLTADSFLGDDKSEDFNSKNISVNTNSDHKPIQSNISLNDIRFKIPFHSRYRLPEAKTDFPENLIGSNNKKGTTYILEDIPMPTIFWHHPGFCYEIKYDGQLQLRIPQSVTAALFAPNSIKNLGQFSSPIFITPKLTLREGTESNVELNANLNFLTLQMPVSDHKYSEFVKWSTLLIVLAGNFYLLQSLYQIKQSKM
ncbi:hypothetical protein AYI69_g4271 [Smittium culicis]|uniref:Protein PBN1 n=1 Tax=Smittium culicis TaxID=133412 RepID=A0A1R1YEY6_9FUNG|nr:hypothetical protein AYI69_g4271 [Smittium culicis]